MKYRKLGGQGLEVSAIGFGCMGISIAYGPTTDEDGIKAIQKAFDVGINFFDTAEVYGTGHNEQVLGKAVKGFRDKVVLATKFGVDMEAQPFGSAYNSRPENIKKVAEKSMKYLQTDYLDVFYQHIPDPNVPIEEVAGAVGDLIKEGKVKYFGLSNVGSTTIRRAHAITPVSVLQSEYSVFERELDDRKITNTLQELGIGLVPYSPLGRGFLTSAVKPAEEYAADDYRRIDERWKGENYIINKRAVEQLKELAESKNITVAQLALAWILAQHEQIVPIPGTRSPQRVIENAGAADIDLTATDLQTIAEIIPNGSAGSRYPESMMGVYTQD